ncbi:PA4642 family protein [Pseudohaliea rubra]|uniref:Aminopeptidase N n=1 Tax=Pseudohaliea rubra DSM 19751 TaxID=1265313 RepID=A0A095VQ24_9GAMM|nr:PA4642 family protein [Pseudohaliea rubra]KGE03208.1 Aminopeptidase N [Pseudohaliea rubra DSM 19751]
MRKDKSKVIDEQWDDARVKSFLAYRAHDGTPDDFHILLRAYQGMRAEDFSRFLVFFAAEGRDMDARNGAGETVLDIVAGHRLGGPYAEALRAAGAGSGRTATA